jgi:hypothetical protein
MFQDVYAVDLLNIKVIIHKKIRGLGIFKAGS